MKRIFVLTLFLSFWSIITISANNAKTDSLYQCKEENDFTNGLDNRAPSFLINESFLDYEEEKSLY